MKKVIAVLLALMPFLFPPSAEAAATAVPNSDNLVVLNGDINTLPTGKYHNVTTLNGNITFTGEASGNIVALNGDIQIAGMVQGSVFAPNGHITVAPTSQVSGDVRARFQPTVPPGAQVQGTIGTTDMSQVLNQVLNISRTVWWIAASISSLILGLLVLWFTPKVASAAIRAVRTSFGTTVGWGFITGIGLPILALIAIATVIAFPLGIGIFAILGPLYALAYILGAWMIGRLILRNRNNRFGALFLGWAIVRILALIPFLGSLTWLLVTIFGLGSLSVALWRSRRGGEPEEMMGPETSPRAMPA